MSTESKPGLDRIMPLLLGLIGLGLSSCVPMQGPGSSDETIRYHNWWNYYERGVGRLQAERVAEARDDFEICLGLRPGAKFGYDRDLWRARTYGLHFAEDFFPNRELGICLFRLGDLEGASRFLNVSLQQTPSGRARHYMNLVRAAQLKGAQVSPPVLILDEDCRTLWTKERRRVLSGLVKAEGFVQAIQVNAHRIFIELADHEMKFRDSVALLAGMNRVRLECRDLAGGIMATGLVWMADWQPPTLSIRSSSRTADGWVMEGVCTDDGALHSVAANGTTLFEATSGNAETRDTPVRLRGRSGQPIVFRASDAAGNVLDLVLTEESVQDYSSAGRVVEYASSEPAGVADAGAQNPTASRDSLKPSLRLSNAGKTLTVFQDEYLVDGDVADGGGIAVIRLNGEDVLKAGTAKVARQYFSRRVSLELGTNLIEVACRDMAGNETVKSVTLVRREPDYLGDNYRLSIGVPPILPSSNGLAAEPVAVKGLIEQELVSDPPRFHLLERDEGWDYILREQQLSLSDLADPSAALRIGKMLPADLLLMGRMFAAGSGLTVQARVVETATGRILCEDDVYTETTGDDLAYQLSGLVMKIEQKFPLLEGKVTGVTGDRASISSGDAQNARVGLRFIAIQSRDAGTLESGDVLKLGEQVVELQVSRVEKNKLQATVLPGKAGTVLKPGDFVYTR